jgi:hypothetical protein
MKNSRSLILYWIRLINFSSEEPKSISKLTSLILESNQIIWEGNMGSKINFKSQKGSEGVIYALQSKNQTSTLEEGYNRDQHSFKKVKKAKTIETSLFKVFTTGKYSNSMISDQKNAIRGLVHISSEEGLNILNVLPSENYPGVLDFEKELSKAFSFLNTLVDEDLITLLNNKNLQVEKMIHNEENRSLDSKSDCSEDSKTFEIFVGGLSSDVSHIGLLNYFKQFGDIISCEPQFWTSGSKKSKCKGFGILVCGNLDTFNKILH